MEFSTLRMIILKFMKMQGIGNDYVYVNAFEENIPNPASYARKLSDRHFGVGSDGLILIMPSETADFRMRMFNMDGSEAEMCGNGIRCFGKFVYDNKLTDKKEITVETLGGIKKLELLLEKGAVAYVCVDMGEPILDAELIPVKTSKNNVIAETIEVLGEKYEITCVSMGNPHAVVFVEDVDSLDLATIGPAFEQHEVFPARVNTEFIQTISDKHLKMRVWERGSGETLACGTGACASLVAAVLNKKSSREATLTLLGGDLLVKWDETDDHVYMTGPAITVFHGEISNDLLKDV